MDLRLNGRPLQFDGDPETLLLDWLRDGPGLTSMKAGCSPQAACGSCCVAIDGVAQLSCSVKMRRLEGASVLTLEGLPAPVREALAAGFAEGGGVQCGFCTPGIAMRAAMLLSTKARPTRQDIVDALEQHVCRCTGYAGIIRSIERAGEWLRGEVDREAARGARDAAVAVGDAAERVDARALVMGERPFVADLRLAGMLHAALVLSDHPRALIRGIETGGADATEGVVRIITAADVPGERNLGLIVEDWPALVAVGETTRYVGDVIAVVVAETRKAARLGAARVVVDADPLPPVTDPRAALGPASPLVHAGGNLLSRCEFRRGDVDSALNRAAHVVSRTFVTQRVEHAFLEPECCLAEYEDDGVKLWSQGQGVYEDQRQIARLLGLPRERVRVIQVPNGGAFGGKEDLTVQGHAALAAWLLRRPVRLELSREESLRVHPKRHPMELVYTVGCDAEGGLLAVRARILADTGAYASVGAKVVERAAGHATGAYHVPAVDIEAHAVYTNNLPSGAFRGFGVNQANFAMECCLDELAEVAGIDRWQIRWDNALTEGRMTATGQILEGGVGVRACLEAVEPAFRAAGHAGLAAGIKNTGAGNGRPDIGRAKLVVRSADCIEVHHGWTEMGQGCNTVAQQFACGALGVPAETIRVVTDTAADVVTGMTTASRATSLIGHSVLAACAALRADLAETSLANLVGRVYRGEWICDWTTPPGEPDADGRIVSHYSYAYAAQVVVLDGAGRIAKVVAAHDAGHIVNPALFAGQIEGAVHMGIGYALSEELDCIGGRPETLRFGDLGLISAADTPPVEVIGIEVPDPHGPMGAKGVGEIGLVPTAAAIANAFAAYDGVRRQRLPMERKRSRRLERYRDVLEALLPKT